jgi:alkanesulfonate monooxygenase SsuD/methylene tetrahydromethanopterin reductase-like flavin-dependent oxidoreductase (luciferase family)
VGLGLGSLLKTDPTMPDDALTADYLADHLWLVGSPKTVTDKIMTLYDATGGFGYLLMVSYDESDERSAWTRNLSLLVNEVAPACDRAEAARLNRVEARQ